jgi:hypothetical protein
MTFQVLGFVKKLVEGLQFVTILYNSPAYSFKLNFHRNIKTLEMETIINAYSEFMLP